MPDLRVKIGSLTLPNPVLVAAGTFGYGLEFTSAIRLDHLGALITKTLTATPRSGHLPPRLAVTPSGILNSVGLQNIGLEAFLETKLPQLRRYSVAVIVSVLGESAKELAEMVGRIDRADGIDGIELNLSCPNLNRRQETRDKRQAISSQRDQKPDMSPLVAQDAEATAAMVQAARSKSSKLLIAKLSPDVTDLRPIARAAERAGADALSVGNTFIGMSLDPETRRSRLGSLTGGLSGPAIRPLSLYRVWYTAPVVRIPVIGTGGIVQAKDAVEYFLAGAKAVAVGTANFVRPDAARQIVRGIERYMIRHKLSTLHELYGAIDFHSRPWP